MGLRDTFLNMLGADIQTGEMKKSSNNLLRSSRDFLKYGNREQLLPTWSDIKMSDKDMYRGYSYAVIQKRGNKVASLARENLITSAKPEVLDEYQKKDETVYHPYLKVIQNSQKFTEKQFWKTISIYLDLAGRYYLGVVRKQINPIRKGYDPITTDVVEFILLNPYEIRRVIDKDKNLAGYVERKSDGRYREWPIHQIIEMRELNPFDLDNGHWAMTDAAKEAVYTINQSGDYTRQSLNGNIDAPGIITTDLILSDEDFMNFKSRVQQHTKGEPLFGNGTGAIHWDSMQIDLDKAALLDINEINRTTLFAVSGTSKTSLGIEQSGTTRETARVQSEQFISDTAQPRLEDIVDFLNLDYKQHYPNEYKQTGYNIDIKSAVGRDYATEAQAVQLRQSQVELALSLIQSGYTQESAYQYAQGNIELDGLELEKGVDKPRNLGEGEQPDGGVDPNSPQNPQTPNGGGNSNEPTKDTKTKTEEKQEDETDPKAQEQNSLDLDLEPHSELVAHNHEEGAKCTCEGCDDEKIETYVNQVNEDDGKILNEAYDNLLGDIRKIQAEAIQDSVEKLTINAFEESDILTEDDKKSLLKKLKNAIKRYWWVLMPMFGNSLMARRNQEFGENTMFVFTNELQGDVESNAMTVAEGHLATIIKDILGASNKAYTDITEKAAAELIIKAYKKDPAKFSEYFTEEPTETEVKKAIENTDILEHNRRIYEKANKLALEGYDRNSIVKAVKAEYEHLSTARATTIAHNETSRAFTHSQYQADTQFLKSINKLDVAYKQLYSRSGNPCKYCQALIDKGPIPFTQNFLDKGQEIVINENGKTSTFRADYEAIQAGVVHCNCQCAYKLVFKDEDGKISSIYNTLWDKGADDSDTSYRGWLNSHSANEQKTLNGGDGSGNFGHLGRPGKVGGSASSSASGGTSTAISDINYDGLNSDDFVERYDAAVKASVGLLTQIIDTHPELIEDEGAISRNLRDLYEGAYKKEEATKRKPEGWEDRFKYNLSFEDYKDAVLSFAMDRKGYDTKGAYIDMEAPRFFDNGASPFLYGLLSYTGGANVYGKEPSARKNFDEKYKLSETIDNNKDLWTNYDKELYRGVSTSIDKIRSLTKGSKVDMGGISSWSSEKDISDQFSRFSLVREGEIPLIFIDKSKKHNQTMIYPISSSRSGLGCQYEYLQSGSKQYTVNKIYEKGGTYYAEVESD